MVIQLELLAPAGSVSLHSHVAGTRRAPLAENIPQVGSDTAGSKDNRRTGHILLGAICFSWVPFHISGNTSGNLIRDKNNLFQDSFSHLNILDLLNAWLYIQSRIS